MERFKEVDAFGIRGPGGNPAFKARKAKRRAAAKAARKARKGKR